MRVPQSNCTSTIKVTSIYHSPLWSLASAPDYDRIDPIRENACLWALGFAAASDAQDETVRAGDIDFQLLRGVGLFQHAAAPEFFSVAEHDEFNAGVLIGSRIVDTHQC